jgi:hypothetical protein
MKTQSRVVAVVVCGLVFAGCQKSDPLIGSWKGTTEVMAMPADSALTFMADKTYLDNTTIKGPAGQITLSATGVYKFDGKSVELEPRDVQMIGGSQQAQNTFNASSKAELLKPIKFEVKFEGDKMTSTFEGKSLTYTRNTEDH